MSRSAKGGEQCIAQQGTSASATGAAATSAELPHSILMMLLLKSLSCCFFLQKRHISLDTEIETRNYPVSVLAAFVTVSKLLLPLCFSFPALINKAETVKLISPNSYIFYEDEMLVLCKVLGR